VQGAASNRVRELLGRELVLVLPRRADNGDFVGEVFSTSLSTATSGTNESVAEVGSLFTSAWPLCAASAN